MSRRVVANNSAIHRSVLLEDTLQGFDVTIRRGASQDLPGCRKTPASKYLIFDRPLMIMFAPGGSMPVCFESHGP